MMAWGPESGQMGGIQNWSLEDLGWTVANWVGGAKIEAHPVEEQGAVTVTE